MKVNLLLPTAVLLAAVVAAVARREPPPAAPDYEPVQAPGAALDMDEAPEPTQAVPLRGQVLEALDVAEYTYLRLSTTGGEAWAAVSKAVVQVGAAVEVQDPARMENFTSSTLKRTFPVIYFGHLPESGAASLPPGHPAIDRGQGPHEQAPAVDSAAAGLPEVDVKPAVGKNAHVIAELHAAGARLAGQTVRVSGQVVKVTSGVLGKNYVRIRDRSSTVREQQELTVTTLATCRVGEVVTLQGSLQTDVDVGIGFKYPVLLADATLESGL